MIYIDVLTKKYATFSGRATRKEYWMFWLCNIIISLVLGFISYVPPIAHVMTAIKDLYGLAVLIPSLAIFVRRMHDTDRSGWWILINLIPVIGQIVILVFLVQDSKPDNKYGPNPKAIKTN